MPQPETRVTLGTRDFILIGVLAGHRERLLDVLNGTGNFLRLQDVEVFHGFPHAGTGIELPGATVRRSEVCLAIPDAENEHRPLDRKLSGLEAKKARTALMGLPGFLVEGSVHLKKEGDESSVLSRELTGFVPVTQATVRIMDADAPAWEVPAALVNSNVISFFQYCPAPVLAAPTCAE